MPKQTPTLKLFVCCGILLLPSVALSQNVEEAAEGSQGTDNGVIIKDVPPPVADIPTVERPERPPREDQPAPPYDPCLTYAKDEVKYRLCKRCERTIFGAERPVPVAGEDRERLALLRCCVDETLSLEELLQKDKTREELVKECNCKRSPSALTCIDCWSPQQISFADSCLQELLSPKEDLRTKIEATKEQAVTISITKEEGAERPGKRPTTYASKKPLCECAEPQDVVDFAPICHRNFLKNILAFPCLHPSQETEVRNYLKTLLGETQNFVTFTSLKYRPSDLSFDITLLAPPSQCELLRLIKLDNAYQKKAVLVKQTEEIRVIREVALNDLETPESCIVTIPECLCSAPQADPDPVEEDGEIVTELLPGPTDPGMPVVQEEVPERLFACREGASVAVDIETCQLIWLGDQGDEKCPEIPLQLALDRDMQQLADKVDDCQKGKLLSLNNVFPQLINYIRRWKGTKGMTGEKPDLPSPPIRAFQFTRSIRGEPFAKVNPILPENVILEEPETDDADGDSTTIEGNVGSASNNPHKNKIKIRVFHPGSFPDRKPESQPVNPGPSGPANEGEDSSGVIVADEGVVEMSVDEANAALEEQLTPSYLLIATGSTSVMGGGCSLRR